MIVVVCVLVVQGLLVASFPTGQCENNGETIAADVPSSLALAPPENFVEFNGTAPASDSVAFSESFECEQETIPEPSTIILENAGNKRTNLSETLVNEPTIVDTILTEQEEKISQSLAINNKLVDLELNKLYKTKNANIMNKIDSAISDLIELKFKIASGLIIIKDSIESELETTRKQIRSLVVESKHEAEAEIKGTPSNLPPVQVEKEKTVIVMEEEEKVKTVSETAPVIEEQLAAKIAKINALIDSELAKVDEFVASELAMTEALIQSEVDKVNLFVETKFKPNELVITKLGELESTVEPELAIGMPVEGLVEFSGVVPASGRTLILGNTAYTPSLPVIKENAKECVIGETVTNTPEVQVVEDVTFTGTVPVSGRTIIFGNTGFLHPNLTPLKNPSKLTEENVKPIPISVESGPVSLENTEYSPSFDIIETDNPETEVTLDENSNLETFIIEKDFSEAVPITGDAAFSGVAPAAGRVKIVGSFGCHPLMPAAEGPDGKKYLWLAKRPTNNNAPPVSRKPETSYNSHFSRNVPMLTRFPADFPETVIMDSTKNYERLIEDYEVNDYEIDHVDDKAITVVGEVLFDGKAPAFGSVSITGHC